MAIFDPFKLHPAKPYHLDYSGLDRDDVSRKSPQLLGRLLSDSKTKFVPVWRSQNFFCKQGKPLSAMRVLNLKNVSKFIDGSEIVYLGRNRNQEAYLCLDLSQFELTMLDPLNDYGVFGDLRECDDSIGGDDCSIMGYARAMCHWHQKISIALLAVDAPFQLIQDTLGTVREMIVAPHFFLALIQLS
jgi:NAD+ diphosphatase